jgi:tetraacyldisaccharide 4'-kinase
VLWRRIAYPETQADWIASAALLPLSWLYGLGWRSYEAVYRLGLKRRLRVGIPVVGVGNLSAGGEGKTPLVIELVRIARTLGLSPAISVNAYGSPSAGGTTVLYEGDEVDPRLHGDEPAELRHALPDTTLILGRDRAAAATVAAASKMESLILDDGFQHLPLARTADLVIWDDEIPNKRLLPAGPMREPRSGLRRATAVATPNRAATDWQGEVFQFSREYDGVRDLATGEVHPLHWMRGRKVDAVCAIARPERFLQGLRDLGADLQSVSALPDHDPLDSVVESEHPTIVTEKDAVKLGRRERFFSLSMRVRFDNEGEVSAWLMKHLSR